MTLEVKLIEYGWSHIEDFCHEGVRLSSVHQKDDHLVIIDYDAIFNTEFSYKRYCQKQNEWMAHFGKVYRFINDDLLGFSSIFDKDEEKYNLDQRDASALRAQDPTPLEHLFEKAFQQVYGEGSFRYLDRESSVLSVDGKTRYLDYVMVTKQGAILALEENGISFHHPYYIGKRRYRDEILIKQNSVVSQGGLVFRWDTESLQNIERVSDEILEIVGDLNQYQIQDNFRQKRRFQFYEHQEEYAVQLRQDRENEVKSALVVLPTGTGKTAIALEDLSDFVHELRRSNIVVLVPTREMIDHWQTEFNSSRIVNNGSTVQVKTYAKIAKDYLSESSEAYDYIIFDEAHHAMAPVMRKVLNHYNPRFLLGLTATDHRLDQQKLETVFGEYETHLTLREAIEKGILSPIRAYRLETNIDLSEVRFNGKDYVNADLETTIRVPSRNLKIVDLLEEYFHDCLKGKQGLIFCVNVAHAKEMARLLQERGISAESVDGSDKRREKKVRDYKAGKIQFLSTCSLLTEGWDAPQTSVIVMARPTMSKVLYTQQIGRGTRRCEGKEALYVIDVVDEYGALGSFSNRPWSLHALLGIDSYQAFGNALGNSDTNDELVTLDVINEELITLERFDVFTFEKEYGDHLSVEQLARELFISTGTLKNWIRKNEVIPKISLPFGRGMLHYFHPEQVNGIRADKGLKEHSEETIVEDFWEFIDKGDYTFSYKIYFILSFLEVASDTGEAKVEQILSRYQAYYLERDDLGKVIDRPKSPYNDRRYLEDEVKMKQSMLSNPFEKFERKRFMYHCKDLGDIAVHHRIWEELHDKGGRKRLVGKMKEDMATYYESL